MYSSAPVSNSLLQHSSLISKQVISNSALHCIHSVELNMTEGPTLGHDIIFYSILVLQFYSVKPMLSCLVVFSILFFIPLSVVFICVHELHLSASVHLEFIVQCTSFYVGLHHVHRAVGVFLLGAVKTSSSNHTAIDQPSSTFFFFASVDPF